MSGPRTAWRWGQALAWLIAVAGGLAVLSAEASRRGAEPPGLTAAGLVVEADGGSPALEHRSAPLSLPLRDRAAAGRGARAAGVGLLTLALLLSVGAGRGRCSVPPGAARAAARGAARWLWAAPGLAGVWAIGAEVDGSAGGLWAVGLSLCLLTAWRD